VATGSGPRTAARIFRTVWRKPGISRVDIASSLSLDKSTVTNQVNRLIDLGLIIETEEGEASCKGGRRPIQLVINKKFGRIIGIEVQLGAYVAVVVDLSGEVLGERRGSIELSTENFADSVLGIIAATRAEFGCGDDLLGVGVGIGGLVDSKKGRIRYSIPIGIDSPIDFGKTVADMLEVPCSIENDANCCAWGELAFNRGEDLRDFLFALVEYRRPLTKSLREGIGVGFGVVLGGKVHAGAHGNSGEFRSVFCDGEGKLQLSLREDELARLDRDADVLRRTTDELARNMAMLINTMDFDRVYIGGDIECLDDELPATLLRRLEENWMYPLPKSVDIRYSSLGGKAVAYGAAGMILDRLVSERLLPGLGADPSAATGA
jgi:predicted NBD/HSP70 family sugar kinase